MSVDINKVEKAYASFMEALGLDLNEPSIKETPKRVAKLFVKEICAWLYEEPPFMKTFPNDVWYPGIIIVKDIKVESLCEHHMLPFTGTAQIGYIPWTKKIVGLSKIARLVDHFCRRPQVQEKLTKQIYDHLSKILETENIAVVINAEHMCMKIRGIKDPCSNTTTSLMGWLFMHNPSARDEFFNLLQIK